MTGLLNGKKNPNHKPALIKGIRQSGKTHSIDSFIKKNYDVYIYLNFWTNPDLISVFDGELDADKIIRELSVKMPLPDLVEGRTAFFL